MLVTQGGWGYCDFGSLILFCLFILLEKESAYAQVQQAGEGQ